MLINIRCVGEWGWEQVQHTSGPSWDTHLRHQVQDRSKPLIVHLTYNDIINFM